MAQILITFAAFSADQGSVSSIQVMAHNHLTPASEDLCPLLASKGTGQVHGILTGMQSKYYIHSLQTLYKQKPYMSLK